MLRISVFSPVGPANPTEKDRCQLRSGPKPCGRSCGASAPSRPNRTGPLLGNSANVLPRYKTSAGHEKQEVQYMEISHACRAQKGLQPIITILFVMLLKISSTAGTRGRLLTCWMQIFLPPQQNKSAECWQIIRLEAYSRRLPSSLALKERRGSVWVAVEQHFSDSWLSGQLFVRSGGGSTNAAQV